MILWFVSLWLPDLHVLLESFLMYGNKIQYPSYHIHVNWKFREHYFFIMNIWSLHEFVLVYADTLYFLKSENVDVTWIMWLLILLESNKNKSHTQVKKWLI